MTPPNKQPSITDADRAAAEKFSLEHCHDLYGNPILNKTIINSFIAGKLDERAKVDELVRALERIRDLPMEGVTLTRQRIATEALKQFSGRSE